MDTKHRSMSPSLYFQNYKDLTLPMRSIFTFYVGRASYELHTETIFEITIFQNLFNNVQDLNHF